jgi:hypothetical protein
LLVRPLLNGGTLGGQSDHQLSPVSMNQSPAVWAVTGRNGPWGDYGHTLVHGMSRHLPRLDGCIQLERAAPFVPPLSFPVLRDPIVTAEFRVRLESLGLRFEGFKPVLKARITRVDWETWDTTGDLPPVLPTSGEPCDYVLDAPHDLDLARQIGDLWELIPAEFGVGEARVIRRARPRTTELTLRLPDSEPPDFFRAKGLGYVFATSRARETIGPDARWLEFRPVILA